MWSLTIAGLKVTTLINGTTENQHKHTQETEYKMKTSVKMYTPFQIGFNLQ